MGVTGARAISVVVGLVVIALLYRRIGAVGKLMVVLWVGMLITVLVVIVSGLTHFNAKIVFDFPPARRRKSKRQPHTTWKNP